MSHRFGFILEHTLGHITHRQNLKSAIDVLGIDALFIDVPYAGREWWANLPVVRNNWTLKLSRRARTMIRDAERSNPFDAVFFHTQVTAHLSLGLMRHKPCVVSMDATPANRVAVEGGTYTTQSLKHRWTSAVLHRARAIVAWSEFVARSARDTYGVLPEKVHVIPPGVDTEFWCPSVDRLADGAKRILFVGGDFRRKGGDTLLAAADDGLGGVCTIDVVTNDRSVVPTPSVRVHHDVAPNSESLRQLFRQADLFVLPTRKDFSPLAILEAMACGVPVIASHVGAIDEQIVAGETGLLITPNDPAALIGAIRALLGDEARRRSMGLAARRRAEAMFDSRMNAGKIVDLMRDLIGRANP